MKSQRQPDSHLSFWEGEELLSKAAKSGNNWTNLYLQSNAFFFVSSYIN